MNSVSIEILAILTAFLIYWFVITLFKGKLERRNISVVGPILLIRTKRGLKILDLLARPKRFWRVFGDFGTIVVLFGMAYMVFLILVMDYVMLTSPPKPSPATNPRNVLLIPGLNEFVPLTWGLIGLIVTLIIHEFSHAILARVENVRVKSLGVVLALIPIGGFAEPDERELLERNKRARMRIYSAGIVANFAVALIAFSVFFHLLGFLQPHVVVVKSFENFKDGDAILKVNGLNVETAKDLLKAVDKRNVVDVLVRDKDGNLREMKLKPIMGVYIVGIINNTPAMKVGMKANSVIIAVNGIKTPNVEVFREIMLKTKPNQTVSLMVLENSKVRVYNVTLSKMDGHGFIGVLIGGDYFCGAVVGYSKNVIDSLTNIPLSPEGLFRLTAMPFYFRSFDGITNYFTPKGFFANYSNLIFYLLNAFYWIAWLNFYVGLFNCLPAIPLDGGRLLNDLLKYVVGEKMANALTRYIAIFVFASIVMSIVVPNVTFSI